jgi:dihydrofolate reductase
VGRTKWGEFDAPTTLIFGSPILVRSLTSANLVDEYHVLVHPVIVRDGMRLFENIGDRKDFHLESAQTFEHGAILVHYDLVKA